MKAKPLQKYQKKRDFTKTPEPAGGAGKTGEKLAFVVQQHHARQMHYDFRLELDGVLKSWAIPKGPSMDPHVHHLAVMTEDHPYEYKDFEGVIPKGNYGAGNVIIWDKGEYSPLNNGGEAEIRQGLKNGHITFFLFGQKLQGEFALIKLKNAREDDAWLLVKKGDTQAMTKDITKQDKSVVSGKKVDQLSSATDIANSPKKAMPKHITPMLCTLVSQPFDGDDWLFELKWDGFRAIGAKKDTHIELYSRNGLDFSQSFAPVAEALHNLKDDVVLDGEIVVLDKTGHAHFEWMHQPTRPKDAQLYYYAFDILWLNGHDLTNLPLITRKQILRKTIPNHSVIRYSDHVLAQGRALFAQMQKNGLEGIVAKKSSSTYKIGLRGLDWQKIKTNLRQEAVIGGFTDPRGTRNYIGSLILGVYKQGKLKYIGHSGGGIGVNQLKEIYLKLKKLERSSSPFFDLPKQIGTPHWVEPVLVCEASFSEWTSDGRMRHPKFEGLRPDKNPKNVHIEKPKK